MRPFESRDADGTFGKLHLLFCDHSRRLRHGGVRRIFWCFIGVIRLLRIVFHVEQEEQQTCHVPNNLLL
jgi:hypothetical protein